MHFSKCLTPKRTHKGDHDILQMAENERALPSNWTFKRGESIFQPYTLVILHRNIVTKQAEYMLHKIYLRGFCDVEK
jgi:hypothetical protein